LARRGGERQLNLAKSASAMMCLPYWPKPPNRAASVYADLQIRFHQRSRLDGIVDAVIDDDAERHRKLAQSKIYRENCRRRRRDIGQSMVRVKLRCLAFKRPWLAQTYCRSRQ
jgi:hypothetical protein